MTSRWLLALLTLTVTAAGAPTEIPAGATTTAAITDTTLERMPAALETRFALSALPPKLRGAATVYLLDPARGHRLARQGTSGVACLVQRTAWEHADYRNDIYIPLCYDAVGATTHLRAIMDAAELRARGTSPHALKAEIARRYDAGTYRLPAKAGLSYMLAPVFRTTGLPDMKVKTIVMPHLMFYASGVTNADIGALPDVADPASLAYPFIDRQGHAEQSYMIQMMGATETARILAEEKALIDDLCAYRELLCLRTAAH
ncbi:MAG TPA: hypothetical protein VEA99_20950 [Gemmatimonadaceae bacterium]|nr:hypothetical protein [Gemmatimonadaceae bacterium]